VGQQNLYDDAFTKVTTANVAITAKNKVNSVFTGNNVSRLTAGTR
jgi:hypothetical protein